METEIINHCCICNSKKLINRENISKCKNCKFIFENPRPKLKELKNFYSKPGKYEDWLKEEKGRSFLWKKRLKKLKKHHKKGNLLDIGTGIGQFLKYAQREGEVNGTEISKIAIKIGKKKYGLKIIEGGIEEIKFSKSFDNITLFHLLEHVLDPQKTIQKCYSLLNKGGIVTIAVPNDINSLRYIIKRTLQKIKLSRFSKLNYLGFEEIRLDGTMDEIHLSHFTEKVLKKLLKKNDFKLVYLSLDPYFSSIGYKRLIDSLYYYLCLTIKKIFRVNIYDCIWIVGKKE